MATCHPPFLLLLPRAAIASLALGCSLSQATPSPASPSLSSLFSQMQDAPAVHLALAYSLSSASSLSSSPSPAASAEPASPPAPVAADSGAPSSWSGLSVQRWEVRLADINLHTTFQRWAREAGYRIKWDAHKHVLIDAPDVYAMDFEDAISTALSTPGIQFSEYPLEACIYPNTPPLVRITRRGEQDKECQ